MVFWLISSGVPKRCVMRSNSLPVLLQFICDEVVQLFGYHFAWLGKKESDGEFSIAAQSGKASAYLQALQRIGVRWDDTPQGKGPAGSCVRSGQLQVFKISDSSFQPWRASSCAASRNRRGTSSTPTRRWSRS